jgi:hypothetical protein
MYSAINRWAHHIRIRYKHFMQYKAQPLILGANKEKFVYLFSGISYIISMDYTYYFEK